MSPDVDTGTKPAGIKEFIRVYLGSSAASKKQN